MEEHLLSLSDQSNLYKQPMGTEVHLYVSQTNSKFKRQQAKEYQQKDYTTT